MRCRTTNVQEVEANHRRAAQCRLNMVVLSGLKCRSVTVAVASVQKMFKLSP